MNAILSSIVVAIFVIVFVVFVAGTLVSRLYRKVPQGKALVVSTMKKVVVTFTGRVVIPVVHRAEVMDISVKTIEIDRRGPDGLICRDNIRADIKVNFFVRVNKAEEDVIKVAQAIGTERASDPTTLEELFTAKFSEALKTAGKNLDFTDLYTERSRFRDAIIEIIGTDLNGYSLEDAAIDYLEQTPLDQLDDNNILDAEGIRKITELTAIQHVQTNNATNEELKQLTAKNVETKEAVLELERQEADATARQAREVASVQAREEAAAAVIQSEEYQRSEQARLEATQALGIQKENIDREIEVAAKNRERVIAVEGERVEKARQIEVVAREVETTAAEKELETEKMEIAERQRDRVAVEKTVAEEEEAIATLRRVEEANREREATVITAEADAESALVKDIKAAEAAETASNHIAAERITIAKADLEAADLDARAKARQAEGIQAMTAAEGLAEVQVKEADAGAITRLGAAEASAIEAKLKGEAAGLIDKASAMRDLEGVGQEHEEFVRQLEAKTKVQLADVEAKVGIARHQAEAISKSLESANIDIVGGSDIFVDRLIGAVAGAKSADAWVEKSETVRHIGEPYLNGDADLVRQITDAVGSGGAAGVRDLTVSAFLGGLMRNADDDARSGLSRVLDAVNNEGLGDLPMSRLLGN